MRWKKIKTLRTFFLSAFLVLALLAGPIAAGAAEAPAGSRAEGVWKLIGMTSDGKTTTKEELAIYEDLGMVMYMELRKDDTALVSGFGEDMSGFSASIQCENKTDHEILIAAENVCLNKYIFKPTWAMSIEAAETRTTDLICSPDDLERSGISAVDELILMDSDEEDEAEKNEVNEVSSELRIIDRSKDTPQIVATEKIVFKP